MVTFEVRQLTFILQDTAFVLLCRLKVTPHNMSRVIAAALRS